MREEETRPGGGRPAQEAEQHSRDGGADGKGRISVLIVDDNEDAALTLSDLIGLWGYGVHTAYGALEALEVAGRERRHEEATRTAPEPAEPHGPRRCGGPEHSAGLSTR